MSINKLLNIFSVMRPHDDPYEKAFVEKFLLRDLAALNPVKLGPMENIVVKVPGTANGPKNEKVLFSCHTDTVHAKGGPQEVMYDAEMGHAYKGDQTQPLGADDGTGVWLMLEMIEAGVPGTYVFHRGEECGCVGSKWMSTNAVDFLKEFDFAIAFDRRDEDSIITYQRNRRTCSDEFATAFAAQLNALNNTFKFKPDNTGVFTDTANYLASIRECTNISVGYTDAHTGGESQDVSFAMALREVLIKMDWEKLVAVREAKDEPYHYPHSSYYDEWERSGQGSFGYSSSNFREKRESWVSPEYAVRELRGKMERVTTRNRMPAMIARILNTPPLSMHDVLIAPSQTDDTAIYLHALMRLDPDTALLVMLSGLQYYQAYRLQLREVELQADRGRFGELPYLTAELSDNFDRHQGFLVRRTALNEGNAVDSVLEARAARKAAEKARKAAKKAAKRGKGADAGNVRRFPEASSKTIKPTDESVNSDAHRLALRNAAGVVPFDLGPFLTNRALLDDEGDHSLPSSTQLNELVDLGIHANDGYAG